MGITELTNLVRQVLEKLNLIQTNAKKVHELPLQEAMNPESKIPVYNPETEQTEQLEVQKIIDEVNGTYTNQLLFIGNITVVDNDLTIPAGCEWVISGVNYFTSVDSEFPIPFAETGKTRIDIIVAKSTGVLELMQGVESDSVAVRPNIPLNSVLVTQINVTDDNFGPVTDPAYLTLEEQEAIHAANTPSGSNPFATMADIVTASTPSLPQVLAQGDRPVRLSDGDGETILELDDRGKVVYNQDADDLILPAELYPVNTVLKIHNAGDVDLFSSPDDLQPNIFINGITVDEFSPITLRAGTAVLKKTNGDPFSETWILTHEVLDFSKDALGLGLVDNTPDSDKEVSGPQATAIADAQSAAQTYAKNYTDNLKIKTPARIAIDTNVSLTEALTVGPIILITGDVVLCLAQTDAKQNGLWVVNQTGAWTRTEDFRTGLDVSFVLIPVLAGTYAGKMYSTGAGRIVGTNNISLQQLPFTVNWGSFTGSVTDQTDLINWLALNYYPLAGNPNGYVTEVDLTLQRQIHENMPVFGSATLNNVRGIVYAASGATPRTFSSINEFDRNQRMGIVSATTGNAAQLRQTQLIFTRNSGFDVTFKLGMVENATGSDIRFFGGISSNTGVFGNTEPNTLLNTIAVCKPSTSNNLHIIHNDASGIATSIDLGANYPMNTISTDVYNVRIRTSGSNVIVTVNRVGTAFTHTQTLSTDLPSLTQGLNTGFYIVVATGTNTLTGFDFMGCKIIV